MEKAHQKDGEKSPGNGTGQADVSVELKAVLGIIPVPYFEEGLHGRAGDIFQCRGGKHAEQPYQIQVVLHRQCGKQNDDGAKSIDRQQGTVQKAPVDPAALAHGYITRFPDPAAKAVKEEQQDPLSGGIDVHGCSFLNPDGPGSLPGRWLPHGGAFPPPERPAYRR